MTSTTNPPIHSVVQAVNSSLYACKVAFSRTQKCKFECLEFLLFRDSNKDLCISVCPIWQVLVGYCSSNVNQIGIFNSTNILQLEVRTSYESDWLVMLLSSSSVARGGSGGGSSPPHWLVKYAKSHAFCAFEANFMWKMENSPPHSKTAPPQTSEFAKLDEIAASILAKTFFFFFFFFFFEITWFWSEKTFEFRISAEKSLRILAKTFFFFFLFFFLRSPDFGRKKPLNFGFRPNFGEDLFFFCWSSPDFGRKKALNFRAFRDISPQVSGKPSEIDSRLMKIRVKVVCTLLTLSK